MYVDILEGHSIEFARILYFPSNANNSKNPCKLFLKTNMLIHILEISLLLFSSISKQY